MIEVWTCVHKNYWLLEQQRQHWQTWMKGDFRLRVLDTTPPPEAKKFSELNLEGIYSIQRVDPPNSFDGVSHGTALDWAVQQCETDIIGFTDTDHFWFNPGIIDTVQYMRDFHGIMAMGDAGFYHDFQRVLDVAHPDRAGHLAPVCWGMFVDRKLASEQTFVSTPQEGAEIRETGWRLRERLIQEKIPTVVFQGFMPYDNDSETVFFGEKDKPQSMHMLQGSARRAHMMEALVPKYLEDGKSKWK